MKKSKFIIAFIVLSSVLSPLAADESAVPLYDKTPQKSRGVSTGAAMLCDIAPGGGHFYIGDYWRGSFFAAGKLGGYGALYFCYDRFRDKRDLYRRADRIRAAQGVNDSVKIHGPDGKHRSVNSYRRDYDRATQWLTFSVIGNAAIQTASMIIVYGRCQEINRNAVPSFDVAILGDGKGPVVYCGLTCRF
ncbi:MAG TPA: hypothetical protein PKK43_01025 [Spirochaetota bacterium]|nr:hypothetical protein [Spirochaetota bacterium]